MIYHVMGVGGGALSQAFALNMNSLVDYLFLILLTAL